MLTEQMKSAVFAVDAAAEVAETESEAVLVTESVRFQQFHTESAAHGPGDIRFHIYVFVRVADAGSVSGNFAVLLFDTALGLIFELVIVNRSGAVFVGVTETKNPWPDALAAAPVPVVSVANVPNAVVAISFYAVVLAS